MAVQNSGPVNPSSGSQWIVLINKSPKGPLTELEIRTLVQQGVLRMNDLAFRVGGDADSSQWKFLWQFDEFDRRKGLEKPAQPKPADVSDKEAERRKSEPPPDPKHLLPEELLNITPDELIVRTKAQIERRPTVTAPVETPLAEASRRLPISVGSGNSGRWLFGGGVVIALGVAFWFFSNMKSPTRAVTSSSINEPQVNSGGNYNNGPLSGSLSPRPVRRADQRPPLRAQQPPAPMPRAPETLERPQPDRGEVNNAEPFPEDEVWEDESAASEDDSSNLTEEEIAVQKRALAKKKKRIAPIKGRRPMPSDEPVEDSEEEELPPDMD